MSNVSLELARRNKEDEFYTQLSDIEAELRHYKSHFKGKTILCNCDDPYESNFFKYFAMNFNHLGLKKLIATSYLNSPIAGTQLTIPGAFSSENEAEKIVRPHKIEITEVTDVNQDGATDLADVEYLLRNRGNGMVLLQGNGDFRSQECIDILKEADIVVTNPPFSLFREYVAQLIEYGKSFVIIGSINAIAYIDVFPLLRDNVMWLGNGFPKGNAYFMIPEHYRREWADGVFDERTGLVKFRNVTWFTNLDIPKRHEQLTLFKKYSPEEYPHYDNYDAIEVSKTADIPYDYAGVMGVPISFMDKYNPDQFEIMGSNRGVGQDPNGIYGRSSYVNGKEKFKRIFIRRREPIE